MDRPQWIESLLNALRARPFARMLGIETTLGQMALAVATIVAGLFASRILFAAYRRFARRGAEEAPAEISPALRRAVTATAVLASLLLASWQLGIDLRALLDLHIFELSGTSVTVLSLLIAATILLASNLLSHAARVALTRSIPATSSQARANTATIGRLLHYGIMLVGTALALETLGLNLRAVLAVGGMLMVALGFAMKNIAENFVSGLILMIERAIKPLDVLEVEGRVVQVQHLGIRATIVRTRDGEELIVPNSLLVQSTVKNYTYRDSHYRLRAQVGVTYSSDLEAVSAALDNCVRDLPWGSGHQPPRSILTGFGDSAVLFEVEVWMDDPWKARSVASDLHRRVWDALKDAGVTIAFPQLDLHLDPPALEALSSRARAV